MRKFYYHKDKEVLFRFVTYLWLNIKQTNSFSDYYYCYDDYNQISGCGEVVISDFLEEDKDSEHIEAYEPAKYNHISKYKL